MEAKQDPNAQKTAYSLSYVLFALQILNYPNVPGGTVQEFAERTIRRTMNMLFPEHLDLVSLPFRFLTIFSHLPEMMIYCNNRF